MGNISNDGSGLGLRSGMMEAVKGVLLSVLGPSSCEHSFPNTIEVSIIIDHLHEI